jgi:hypothetical protein
LFGQLQRDKEKRYEKKENANDHSGPPVRSEQTEREREERERERERK